jgi:amino-acid N-acetyltransferase
LPLTKKPAQPLEENSHILHGNGVNLGSFYGNTRAVAESPKFVQHPQRQAYLDTGSQLHVALVKIRAPQSLNDDILNGVGRTISQLGRLGLSSVIVVDCNEGAESSPDVNSRTLTTEQANRVAAAIDANGEPGTRVVNNIIGISETTAEDRSAAYLRGKVHVTLRKLLMIPLRRGTILVIPSIGYTDQSQISIPIQADDVVLALTRELAGFQSVPSPDEDPDVIRERLQKVRNEISLDRLIILDPLGGIPASDRPNGYHVFLNMEQEFESAKQDILAIKALSSNWNNSRTREKEDKPRLGPSNSSSNFHEGRYTAAAEQSSQKPKAADDLDLHLGKIQHLKNLQLARSVLSILPPSSSAVLTTPDEAANSGRELDTPFQATGVGTRRQKNPLIHNLLTDKPVFSSSLPVGRLGPPASSMKSEQALPAAYINPTTFAKHGMSVSIFPDPRASPWEPPMPGKPQLMLTDSQIDLPRLVHLIEDSFNRKLDAKDYLRRVHGRIAGVIIAGEYEGGALLTWETPPGVIDDGTEESRARMVPYLDKFAVLKRSQGGSVADVVFNSMVRDCFPSGVCWRSRRQNPVNKWYFERSRGTWKLPGTDWTMFWTTPDLSMDQQRFRDYEGVCRAIAPSWADNKATLD